MTPENIGKPEKAETPESEPVKKVRFSAPALATLRSLEEDDRRHIGYALHQFVTIGAGDVKILKDQEGQRRLRVGDWRIRFIQDPEGIKVLRVDRRDKAYKS